MNSKLPAGNSLTPRAPWWTWALVLMGLAVAAMGAMAQQTNLASGPDFNSFKIVVDRNIFNQSRLPHERAARPAPVADSFSLVGTLFYAGGDIAFFDGTSDQYRKALKVGDEIAGFKVTAVTLDSVTLSEGTNQTVLKITTQMRRDEAGHWAVSTERASYAGAGNAPDSKSQGHPTSSRRFAARNSFPAVSQPPADNGGADEPSANGAEEPPPEMENHPALPAGPGGSDDALARLMQRRAQEEQQLRQGQ